MLRPTRHYSPEPAIIDLYAIGSPNVVKIYIALEEMGLSHTVHPVDVFGEEQFTPEFLKLNPNAKVSVITDHDGPRGKSYTLFESGAILLPGGQDRTISAQGPGREVRHGPVDDGADDVSWPDIRAVHAFFALWTKRERLRARPLTHARAPGACNT